MSPSCTKPFLTPRVHCNLKYESFTIYHDFPLYVTAGAFVPNEGSSVYTDVTRLVFELSHVADLYSLLHLLKYRLGSVGIYAGIGIGTSPPSAGLVVYFTTGGLGAFLRSGASISSSSLFLLSAKSFAFSISSLDNVN